LEIAYLDTGAMYRAVAHAALQRGVDLQDESALLELARSLSMALDCGPTHTRVRIDGHDVTEAIRTLAVSEATSSVARNAEIRELLVAQQRLIGEGMGSFVTEGRDQGSVVFPAAEVRFVLEAALDRRAERRHREMLSEGEQVTLEQVAANLRARDEVDSKQWDTLLSTPGVIVIDTSDMTLAQVVDCLADSANDGNGTTRDRTATPQQ
jgi:cytidylate kinase